MHYVHNSWRNGVNWVSKQYVSEHWDSVTIAIVKQFAFQVKRLSPTSLCLPKKTQRILKTDHLVLFWRMSGMQNMTAVTNPTNWFVHVCFMPFQYQSVFSRFLHLKPTFYSSVQLFVLKRKEPLCCFFPVQWPRINVVYQQSPGGWGEMPWMQWMHQL